MRRASIDIGSNTTLLLVAEFRDGRWHELANESEVTSLGKKLDETKLFDPESMSLTLSALEKYKNISHGFGISADQILASATEASRVALNADDFYKKVLHELGIKVQIINAKGEAFYTALGVCLFSQLPEFVTVMDIGGASTELINIKLEPLTVQTTISLPMGSVRCTEWLEQNSFEEKFAKTISNFDLSPFMTSHLICVAGSMTSLGSMIKGQKEYNAEEIDKSQISFELFKKFLSNLNHAKVDDLNRNYPFLGKRARTIKAGALLGLKLGEALGVNTFEISTRGLRYGTLFSGGIDYEFTRV